MIKFTYPPRTDNSIGERYGKLTEIVKDLRNSRKDYKKSLFICDCGNIILISRDVVLKYHAVNCCNSCKYEKQRRTKQPSKYAF